MSRSLLLAIAVATSAPSSMSSSLQQPAPLSFQCCA